MTQINKPLHDLTVAELAASLRARQVSAVEVAQHFLARALRTLRWAFSGHGRRRDAGPGPRR